MASHKYWFETWFNTHYYDALYQHRDENEAAQFIDRLITYLQPEQAATMLDVACGKGRHAKYLADKGFTVTGIDLSYKNIREAMSYENEKISFFQHDMQNIFRINYFDCIFNFFTSFGYFVNKKDNLQSIRSFAGGLKPGGFLVIDFFNVNHVLDHLVEDESKTIDAIQFNITKSFEDGFIVKKIEIAEGDKREIFYEKVRAITKQEFENYFDACNLKVKQIFGDYKLNTFNSASSERLILIAQK